MKNLKASCQIGASTTIELIMLLESYRESAGVSIQILTKVLLPTIPARTYKCWLHYLATGEHHKNSYAPHRSKHSMLLKSTKALSLVLEQESLPKTRDELYDNGKRVTAYKKEILKLALKSI